jgi:hypothetical protein
MPNTHLKLLQAIKALELEHERNEEDKRLLIIEIREAYGELGPEFGKQVRQLIADMLIEQMKGSERLKSLKSEINSN